MAKVLSTRAPVASPSMVAARPARAQAFKAAPAAAALRPASFGRSLAKLQKVARAEGARVVVVRAADDKTVVIGLAAGASGSGGASRSQAGPNAAGLAAGAGPPAQPPCVPTLPGPPPCPRQLPRPAPRR